RREAGERHEIRFGRAWRKLLWRAWNAGKRIGALPRRARRPRKPPTPNPGAAMTRLKIAATLALLPLTAIAAAAAPQAPAFEAARLSEHVRILSSDAYEGRGPATAGETKAVSYIVQQMKAAGLQPGGPLLKGKRQWTQDVPLLRTSIEGTPRLTLNLGGKTQALSQGDEIAVRAAMTGARHV